MDRRVLFEPSLFPHFEEFDPGELTNDQFRMAQAHAEVTTLMDDVYRQYLEAYIWPHPIIERTDATRKELDRHYRILKRPSVRMPLLLIWRKSSPYKEQLRTSKDAPPYLSESELGLALWRQEQNRLDAAHSDKPAASQKKYLAETGRLVDAALAYGLVVEKEIGKRKPHVDGTAQLHAMMVRIEWAHAVLARDALALLSQDDPACPKDTR